MKFFAALAHNLYKLNDKKKIDLIHTSISTYMRKVKNCHYIYHVQSYNLYCVQKNNPSVFKEGKKNHLPTLRSS